MRARMLAGLAVVALLADGTGRPASAAEAHDCPAECRRVINDLLCRTVETRIGDRWVTEYYFWSDGVR